MRFANPGKPEAKNWSFHHEDTKVLVECCAPFLDVSHAHQHRGGRPASRGLDGRGIESDLASINDFMFT